MKIMTSPERTFMVAQTTSPERAAIYQEAAGQVSPVVEFEQFDLADPAQAEIAAWVLYAKDHEYDTAELKPSRSVDSEGNESQPQTLDQWRKNVESAKQRGRVVIKLTSGQYDKSDFWARVKQLEAERQ